MHLPPPHAELVGIDFSSAPSRRKPVVLASGRLAYAGLTLDDLRSFDSLAGFGDWLAQPGDWLGAFDFPFGLPRELVATLGWPLDWPALMRHYAALSRAEIRSTFAAFCAARPVGGKFAHRACDAPAGSSPSMKWVNPPVAYMLHAGVPLLLQAGVHIPGLCDGDPRRVALEGYPGLLARELIGRRSYKSDTRARQDAPRRAARAELVAALESGRSRLGLRLQLNAAQREALIDDPTADRLDAALCLMQAGWSGGQPAFGMPADVDPVEGWIATAPHCHAGTIP